MANDISLSTLIISILKVLAVIFIVKVVLMIMGFTGYIPIADEVYSFFMKLVLSVSGNKNVLPHNMQSM
jgi:hypothetical protein